MRKFLCTVCGYVYDEAAGDPEQGVAPGTRWEDVPADWTCPLCGATREEFEEQSTATAAPAATVAGTAAVAETETVAETAHDEETDDLREMTAAEMAALCSNLAKGCDKQYLPEEAASFRALADFYDARATRVRQEGPRELAARIAADLAASYPAANAAAADAVDRGAKRALTWSEKVTRILSSLLARYEKQGEALLASTRVYVCEICGFVYIGDQPPDICPICKVPRLKIAEVGRR